MNLDEMEQQNITVEFPDPRQEWLSRGEFNLNDEDEREEAEWHTEAVEGFSGRWVFSPNEIHHSRFTNDWNISFGFGPEDEGYLFDQHLDMAECLNLLFPEIVNYGTTFTRGGDETFWVDWQGSECMCYIEFSDTLNIDPHRLARIIQQRFLACNNVFFLSHMDGAEDTWGEVRDEDRSSTGRSHSDRDDEEIDDEMQAAIDAFRAGQPYVPPQISQHLDGYTGQVFTEQTDVSLGPGIIGRMGPGTMMFSRNGSNNIERHANPFTNNQQSNEPPPPETDPGDEGLSDYLDF